MSAPVLGVYGSPTPLWEKGETLPSLGVNAVFTGSGTIADDLLRRCADEKAAVYAEFATFRGDHVVDQRPDLWPIGEDGERVRRSPRFIGLCPGDAAWKAERLATLGELVRRAAPRGLAGIWIDYLHFHCDFELPQPTLDQTCFDDRCLADFQRHSRLNVPGGGRADQVRWIMASAPEAWVDWKCATMTAFAGEIRSAAEAAARAVGAARPLIGLYGCPWTDQEYDGGIRRVCGEDLEQLASVVDVFSPMVYHRKCGRPVSWPGTYASWLVRRLPRSLVWPIVDVQDAPADEARQVLAEGLAASQSAGASGGVMPFATYYLAEDAGRLAALREVYRRAH